VAWAPPEVRGGRLLATGSADGAARVWALSEDYAACPAAEGGAHCPVVLDHGAGHQVYSVVFSAGFGHAGGGPTLVTAADDAVQCWDLARALQGEPHAAAAVASTAAAAVDSTTAAAAVASTAAAAALPPPAPGPTSPGDSNRIYDGRRWSSEGGDGGNDGASSSSSSSSSSSDSRDGTRAKSRAESAPSLREPPAASASPHAGGNAARGGAVASSWRFAAEVGAPVYGGGQRNANQAAYVFDLALSSQPTHAHAEARGLAGGGGGSGSSGSSGGAGANSLLAAALSDGTCRVSSFGVPAAVAGGSRAVARAGQVAVLSTGGQLGHLTSVAWAPVKHTRPPTHARARRMRRRGPHSAKACLAPVDAF
jgi:hypothetical protein